jgi:2-furoyl-CoA dehydrogenase 2Fe-2S iron sulfur subunit
MDEQIIKVSVNGKEFESRVESRRTLADYLRLDLGLTGTHLGCEHGVCGACTVLINGNTARSCLTLAVQVNDCKVTTIEGLANEDGTLSVLQQAFQECHALQCGFCTPGMLTTLTELLNENHAVSEHEVREAISGNLCRCTGYQSIVDAALLAAKRLREN